MIGERVGLAVGTLAGVACGVGADEIGGAGATLVVVFGQSNATTLALTSGLTDASYATAYSNVQYLSHQAAGNGDPPTWEDTSVAPLDSITFQSADRIGLAHSMMRDLDRARPRGFACFQMAMYGSFLSNQWLPSAPYPSVGPNLYALFVVAVRAAMTATGSSRVVFVWDQGESDASLQGAAEAYQTNLGTFLDQIRTDFGAGALFVYGKTNAAEIYGGAAYLTTLRSAQVAFEATRTNVKLVDQDSVALGVDSIHYDANGCVTRGHLYAAKVALLLGIRVPPVASFTSAPTGLDVAFTDTSLSVGYAISSYLWTFGDGQTSTSQNPTHTYAGAGTYNVTLRITNASGDTNTTSSTPVTVSGLAVTSDATSGKYLPQDGTEWAAMAAAVNTTGGWSTPDFWEAPDALWRFHAVVSGNCPDTIGSFTLTAANTPGYQQAVPGWTSKQCTFTDGGAKSFSSTSASLPDLASDDVLTMVYVVFPAVAPAGGRSILAQGTGGATHSDCLILATTGRTRNTSGANVANGTASPCDGAVHILWLRSDRTNTRAGAITELEKMLATFSASTTGKSIAFGSSVAGTSLGGGVVYAAQWHGVKARRTDAQIKGMSQGLLWSVAW